MFLIDSKNVFRISGGRSVGEIINLSKGEIVVSLEIVLDDDKEKVYLTRFGLGTLPDDIHFYKKEARKIE